MRRRRRRIPNPELLKLKIESDEQHLKLMILSAFKDSNINFFRVFPHLFADSNCQLVKISKEMLPIRLLCTNFFYNFMLLLIFSPSLKCRLYNFIWIQTRNKKKK